METQTNTILSRFTSSSTSADRMQTNRGANMMPLISTHKTHFPKPQLVYDTMGYAVYHDSPRYGYASKAQLEKWRQSRLFLVRQAALVELICRAHRLIKAPAFPVQQAWKIPICALVSYQD